MRNGTALAPGATTMGEKIRFGLGDMGCNFGWTFISGFLTLYYTDSVGISAAFVGTMMLITRVLDGVSDLAMGVVIEKTNTRWGKARPWLLFGGVPMALSLALIFNVPAGLGETAKNGYVFLTYVFMTVIAYTAVGVAYNALIPRFSLNADDRNVVSAVRGVVVIVTALVISIGTPELLKAFGGQQSARAWSLTSILYAALALICLMITFLGVKERIPPKMDLTTGKVESTPIKRALGILLRNKYFYIATVLFIFFYAINGVGGITVYYCRDILGRFELYGLISAIGIVPMVLTIPFAPALYKKFGKRNVMLVGAVIAAGGCVVQLTAPSVLTVFLTGSVVRGFGSILFSASIFTLASDIVEFSDWKHGIRAEGLVTSVNSVGLKVGTGLGSALVGWLLDFGGYNAALGTQPRSALNSMIILQIGVPLILFAALAVLLLFWDLEKLRPQIEKDLAQKLKL
ncbi:MFS transporter [Spirochaetia bacterium]|nr:MFS transporter [Spirochaetia bacterium]